MKKLSALLLLTSTSVYAGSNSSTIECESGSGRTKVSIVSNDFLNKAEKIEFTIDGKSINIPGVVLWQYGEGMVTAVGDTGAAFFEFYGLPRTFKGGTGQYGSVHYTFTGIVQGTDPRPNKRHSPKIEVSCILDYSI